MFTKYDIVVVDVVVNNSVDVSLDKLGITNIFNFTASRCHIRSIKMCTTLSFNFFCDY